MARPEAIRPVILCGGAGSRLAPLSRPDRPKPLLPLGADGRTLLADTLDRFCHYALPLVVCGAVHADAMAAEAGECELLVEPTPRGTAAAALAAALAVDPADVILIAPADHHVERPDALRRAIDAARDAAHDAIVTFGVVPTRAETGYGWIQPGPRQGPVRAVQRFVEKPEADRAAAFQADGWLWNSGMFLVRAGHLVEEARRLVPGLVEDAAAAVRERSGALLGAAFAGCPAGSLDVLIVERTALVAVAPVDCGWSDLGTWAAVRARHGDRWVDDLLRRS